MSNRLSIILRDPKLEWLWLLLGFSLLWLVVRIPLLTDPVMMHDDYFLSIDEDGSRGMYMASYRPVSMGYYVATRRLIPGFYTGTVAKVFSAFAVGGVALILTGIFRRLTGEKWLAVLVAALFVVHPIINDSSAWNTVHYHVATALLAVFGFQVCWHAKSIRRLLGSAAIFLAVAASLQTMMSLPVVLGAMVFMHAGCLEGRWQWAKILQLVAALAIGTVTYLLYVHWFSPAVLGISDFAETTGLQGIVENLRGRWSQTLNLYLNLYQPILSFYLGVPASLSLWKFGPLLVLGLGGVAAGYAVLKRTLRWWQAGLLGATWLGLPFLAVAPLWLIDFYTDWRISTLVLFAQVCVVASVVALWLKVVRGDGDSASKAPSRTVFVGLAGILTVALLACLPPTWVDCRMRKLDYRHDLSLVEQIESFWRTEGVGDADYRVGYLELPRPTLELGGGERGLLTEANTVILNYSSLSYGDLWGWQFIEYHGFAPLDADAVASLAADQERGQRSEAVKRFETLPVELPYVVHYPADRASIIFGMPQYASWRVGSP